MPVNFVSRPTILCWTKNYMHFQVAYWGMTPGQRFQLEFVDPLNSFNVLAAVEYPITAAIGLITIKDIDKIVDNFVSYFQPSFLTTDVSEVIQEATGQTMTFGVRHRIWSPTGTTAWEYPNVYHAISKGGIGDINTQSEFNINHPAGGTFSASTFFISGNRFCTHIPSGRSMRPDEWGWLLYLTEQGATGSGPVQRISYDIKYADGTGTVISRTIPVGSNPDYFGRCWHVPIGIEQAKLDPTNKGVRYYEVVVHKDAPYVELQRYRIYADYRPVYNSLTLYYRNSMGGIDQILLRGVNQISGGEVEKKEYMQHRAFLQINGEGESPYFESEMRLQFRGNTGYISPKHKQALAEAFNSTGAWLMKGNKWLPMRIPAQKMEPISSEDGLHDYVIEFETAGTFKTLPRQLTQMFA